MNKSGLDFKKFYKPYKIIGNQFEVEEWLEPAFNDYEIIEDKYILPKNGEEDIINKIEQLYNFSSYYCYLELDNIKTAKSIICDMKCSNIEEIFNQLNKPVFVRVDRTSSKSNKVFKSWSDAYNDLITSINTRNIVLSRNSNYIFREAILDISNMIEFRCFVFKKILRGISICFESDLKYKNIHLFKSVILSFISKVVISTELNDCSIDLCLSKIQLYNLLNNISIDLSSLQLIEINSPVYLYATSGLFELDLPRHKEILVGKLQPDIISYPVILFQNHEEILEL